VEDFVDGADPADPIASRQHQPPSPRDKAVIQVNSVPQRPVALEALKKALLHQAFTGAL